MGRSLRIALLAFIDDPLDPPGHERFGGGQSFCYDLVRYLVCRGDEVDVVTRLNDGAKERCEKIGFNLRIHRLEVGPPTEVDPATLAPLLPELLRGTTRILAGTLADLDAIHSQYWISGDIARVIRDRCWIRHIRHIHHPLSFQREKWMHGEARTPASMTRERTELAVFASLDALVVLSPAESRTFRILYPECADTHVAIIPHGADYGTFFPRPESTHSFVRRAAERLEKGIGDTSRRS